MKPNLNIPVEVTASAWPNTSYLIHMNGENLHYYFEKSIWNIKFFVESPLFTDR